MQKSLYVYEKENQMFIYTRVIPALFEQLAISLSFRMVFACFGFLSPAKQKKNAWQRRMSLPGRRPSRRCHVSAPAITGQVCLESVLKMYLSLGDNFRLRHKTHEPCPSSWRSRSRS